MDSKDLTNLLEKNKEQLNQILDQCKDSATQLALLASKMCPLLADFSAIESELLSSVATENLDDTENNPPLSQV